MSENPAPAPASATPAPATTPADPTPAAPVTAALPVPAHPAPGDGLPDDPAALKAMIGDLRKENASARTNAKQAAADEARSSVLQELGKALGFITDGETAPDADALAKAATDARAEARTAKVELAVYRTATAHQGDPGALLDSRAFLAKVADLDPAAADFQTQVDAAIKDAVAQNPKLKAAPVAATSSVDHTGGTGEGAITKEQFAAMSAADKNQLYVTNPTLYRQLAGH